MSCDTNAPDESRHTTRKKTYIYIFNTIICTGTLSTGLQQDKVKPQGKCRIKLRNPRNDKLYRLEFQEVEQVERIPLLGRKASEGMS